MHALMLLALITVTSLTTGENAPRYQIIDDVLERMDCSRDQLRANAGRSFTLAEIDIIKQELDKCYPQPPAYPQECINAQNFTHPARSDAEGHNYKVSAYTGHNYLGYSCDFHKDIDWFRFTGQAGRKMLNICPQPYSCGTSISVWTDDDMPTEVGIAKEINGYGQYIGNCR